MKLLLDENLSPRLTGAIQDLFPGSTQVEQLGLRGKSDLLLWDFAKAQDFVLVSKDNDFRQRSFQFGAPPKVVWLAVGNAGTKEILALLRDSRDDIAAFVADPEAALLVVSRID